MSFYRFYYQVSVLRRMLRGPSRKEQKECVCAQGYEHLPTGFCFSLVNTRRLRAAARSRRHDQLLQVLKEGGGGRREGERSQLYQAK